MKKIHPYDKVLAARFGGILRNGKHDEDGEACALEAATVARKKKWSDSPDDAGLPDLRALNDGAWSSDAARTKALVPAIRALWDWPKWSEEQKRALTDRVTLRLIREVLPDVFVAIWLAEHAQKMREAPDLAWAAGAAAGAAWAAEAAAAWAAGAAAAEAARAADAGAADAEEAAWAAAWAAAGAARAADRVLALACTIWEEEARAIK
jgi:hypothetical protein